MYIRPSCRLVSRAAPSRFRTRSLKADSYVVGQRQGLRQIMSFGSPLIGRVPILIVQTSLVTAVARSLLNSIATFVRQSKYSPWRSRTDSMSDPDGRKPKKARNCASKHGRIKEKILEIPAKSDFMRLLDVFWPMGRGGAPLIRVGPDRRSRLSAAAETIERRANPPIDGHEFLRRLTKCYKADQFPNEVWNYSGRQTNPINNSFYT